MIRLLFGGLFVFVVAVLVLTFVIEFLLPLLLAVSILGGAVFLTVHLGRAFINFLRKPSPRESSAECREGKSGEQARKQRKSSKKQQSRYRERNRDQEPRHRRHTGQRGSQAFGGSFYELLGVGPTATVDEIRKAWRKIDFGQHLSIETRNKYFEAYRVLIDPEQRRRYDAELKRRKHDKEESQPRDHSQTHRQQQEREPKRQSRTEDGSCRDQNKRKDSKQQELPNLSGTHYDLLGVKPDSTRDEIMKAWRRFAKRWHTDVCNHPDAKQIIQAANEAKEILSDPLTRRKYDAQLSSTKHFTSEADRANNRSSSHDRHQRQSRHTTTRSRHAKHGRAQDSRGQNRKKGAYRRAQSGPFRGSSHRKGRYFTGTWARIKMGPWSGSWGAWIESLYVNVGDYAYIRRQDGQIILVVVVAILNRSQGNRVTLCRVENI